MLQNRQYVHLSVVLKINGDTEEPIDTFLMFIQGS